MRERQRRSVLYQLRDIMPKLCKCGAIVARRCDRCYPPQQHKKSTKERGYGHDWRRLSERYRAQNPLCERCTMEGRTTPAEHVHHKIKIADAPELRLDANNLMALCVQCHENLEGVAHPGVG